MAKLNWNVFSCSINELKIGTTLACGQSFRWKEKHPGEWTGVIKDEVWKFKQTPTQLLYQVFTRKGNSETITHPQSNDLKPIKLELGVPPVRTNKRKHAQGICENEPQKKKNQNSESSENDKHEATIQDYFQLDVNLTNLYKQWATADSNFEEISANFPGIRMLRQDPVENLFSFICSSNNHISRISGMVEKLCVHFGDVITEVGGEAYYQFPSVSSLAGNDVEQKLRDLGFGYRAKYINQTSKYIEEHHDEQWLYGLRSLSYKDTKSQLMKLCGVGAKVADCVCLMSMDKTGAIPVDTHVWQIASRHYLPKLNTTKSLTDKLYDEIGDCFRTLWGDYAGWAHSVLFTADLKQFQKESKQTKKKKAKDIKQEI